MYVQHVYLQDVRAIASGSVALAHRDAESAERLELPNVNVVLGTNGSGKSTFLVAVAAALHVAQPLTGAFPSPDAWPRLGGDGTAIIRLQVARRDRGGHVEQIELSATSPDSLFREDGAWRREGDVITDGFLAAYGANRSVNEAQIDPSQLLEPGVIAWTLHLLEDRVPLFPIESLLSQTDRRAEASMILNALLPTDVRCLEEPDNGRHFSQRGIPLQVEQLSDGIRSFLAWVGDLLFRLEFYGEGFTSTRGVVLVDEVDQRLHPQWLKVLPSRLGTTFPELQFVLSGQSPLVPSALRRENLLLVEPDDNVADGATTVTRLVTQEVFGQTADQILESPYFNVSSSRSEPFWEELRMLAADAQRGASGRDSALEFMRRLADPQLRGDRKR